MAGTPAGWHPDPMSRFEYRYWDGNSWTENVSSGGRTAIDPVDAGPAPGAGKDQVTPAASEIGNTPAPIDPGVSAPPTPIPTPTPTPAGHATAAAYKLCPHCRAQNATTADICPSCGKKYLVKKKWPWIVAAVFVVMAVSFAGCVAVLARVGNEVVDELNAAQARHAITPRQFRAVTLGSTRAAVVAQLGKRPQDQQSFVSKGLVDDLDSSCIYYNKAGGSFGDRYQFCFQADSLTSKNEY